MLSKPFLFLATGLLVLSSCKKKEQNVAVSIPNEGITTVILTATPVGGGAAVTAKWNQRLGSDGNPVGLPDTSQAVLALAVNTTYNGQITIYDSTQHPPVLVNDEILERGTYHLFFYQPAPTDQPLVIPATPNPAGPPLHLTVTETDRDSAATPLPIGLQTRLVTGSAGTGRLRVVLRHQPGVKDGTYPPGDSDIDIYLGVRIVD